MEIFRIGEAVRFGWEQFKSHFLFIWMTLGSMAAVSVLLSLAENGTGKQGLAYAVVTILSIFVGVVMKLGLIRIYLDLIDQNKEDRVSVLFSQHRLALRYFVASVLYGVIVVLGFILFIIPGIYFVLKYQFFSYLIVDKNLGIFDALKKSAEITKDVKWKLLGFGFALLGLNIAGALALLVGLLVTVPVSVMAAVFVYRALSKRLDVQAAEAVVATATPVGAGL